MSGLVHQLSRSVSAIGRVSRASQADDSDMEAPMLGNEREASTSRANILAAETDTPETPSKDLQLVCLTAGAQLVLHPEPARNFIPALWCRGRGPFGARLTKLGLSVATIGRRCSYWQSW